MTGYQIGNSGSHQRENIDIESNKKAVKSPGLRSHRSAMPRKRCDGELVVRIRVRACGCEYFWGG